MPALQEYDREEFWDVCRRLRPDITREQYELMWDEFADLKRATERKRRMH
jgi:hypothetical protein